MQKDANMSARKVPSTAFQNFKTGPWRTWWLPSIDTGKTKLNSSKISCTPCSTATPNAAVSPNNSWDTPGSECHSLKTTFCTFYFIQWLWNSSEDQDGEVRPQRREGREPPVLVWAGRRKFWGQRGQGRVGFVRGGEDGGYQTNRP